MSAYIQLKSKVLPLTLCLFTVLCSRAAGSTVTAYTVTLNTAPLVGHPAGPFSILLGLTDGSGLGDGNNTIQITNVDFGGGSGSGGAGLFGGATGTLETGVTMNDSAPLSLFTESFLPGQKLSFTVSVTTGDDVGGIPDGVSFYILDNSGLPIPTLSPGAAFLFVIEAGSSPGPPETFGTDPSLSPSTGSPISIDAPVVSSDSTPPVTTATLSPGPNGNGWNNTSVTVTLISTDNEPGGTGVNQITYSAIGAQSIANTSVPGANASFTVITEGITTITVFGTDNAGNVEVPKTLKVQLDKTPPSISCGLADGIWHGSDVNIACTASDAGSGLGNPPDASFSLSTNLPAGTETSNAATGTHSACDVAGNCSTAGPISGNMVDKKPPTINVSSPIAGGSYLLNQAVNANYACTDGGSGVGTCTGTVASGSAISTSPVGSKTFTVNATDNVANVAPPQSVSYSVSYALCLLYDSTRAVQSGSTIPLKIQLCDANNVDVSSSTVVVHGVSLVQTSTNASQTLQASGSADPDNDFRFDSTLGPTGGYIFNLSTKGLTTGSYQLTFTAGADAMPHVLSFQVR